MIGYEQSERERFRYERLSFEVETSLGLLSDEYVKTAMTEIDKFEIEEDINSVKGTIGRDMNSFNEISYTIVDGELELILPKPTLLCVDLWEVGAKPVISVLRNVRRKLGLID